MLEVIVEAGCLILIILWSLLILELVASLVVEALGLSKILTLWIISWLLSITKIIRIVGGCRRLNCRVVLLHCSAPIYLRILRVVKWLWRHLNHRLWLCSRIEYCRLKIQSRCWLGHKILGISVEWLSLSNKNVVSTKILKVSLT